MFRDRTTPMWAGLLLGLWIALPAQALVPIGGGKPGGKVCQRSAATLSNACLLEATEDRKVAQVVCLNLLDPEAAAECRAEANAVLQEDKALCRQQRDARRALCSEPGFAGAYDPEIDPADFVAAIDNPYAPFAVGRRWHYEKETDEGLETILVEVLDDTKEILGVECAVVRDTVWLDGVLIEDTDDWVAQDVDGNVWYFGELSRNYEDGELVDLDGSWIAGEDGAKPGFWMPGAPEEGFVYRQELYWDEAEDIGEVLSTDSDEPVPFATGAPVLQTRDFTPVEPDADEFKFYVPGVGLVKETDPTGEEAPLELVDFEL